MSKAPESDEWCTPPVVVDRVIEFFGGVPDLDPCTSAAALMPASIRIVRAQDGLESSWGTAGSVWLNPPYSKPGPWLDRLASHCQADRVGLALLKLDPSTTWWHCHVWARAEAVCFWHKRIAFLQDGVKTSTATFPSAMVLFGGGRGWRDSFKSFFSRDGKVVML